jgi:predicted DNA-binding protein (MmcQ/YjbR family)
MYNPWLRDVKLTNRSGKIYKIQMPEKGSIEILNDMNIESISEYCRKKKGVTEDFPFDEDTLAIRVMNKIFLLASLEKVPLQINLKCDPEYAVELRERYDSVQPGFHMNKSHWNTVMIDGSIPNSELKEMIDHSYEQVVKGLKKADKAKLKK